MTSPEKVQLATWVPVPLAARFKEVADRDARSVSNLIARLMQEHVDAVDAVPDAGAMNTSDGLGS